MIKYTPQIIPVGWDKVLDIGAGRQVFWDDYLVDTRQTTKGRRWLPSPSCLKEIV